MANTFKFGNKNWAWKEGSVLAYNDENNNFKPLPFDFTRSSSATRVNKDGLIEVVGSDEPRVDYLNNADGHLLLEPSRGNEFTYSNTSVLITGRCTRGDAYTKLGIVDGYEYSVSTSNPNLYLNYTESTLGYKTFSVFIDATNSDYFKIHLATGGGSNNGAFATFTPSTQSFGSITENATYVRNSSVGYDYFGNNIYRIWITTEFILYSGGTTFPLIYFGDNTNVWIGGGQVEKGSYATSYIPTSGSSVTRATDISNATLNSSVLSNIEGTVFIDVDYTSTGNVVILASPHDGAANKRIEIWANGSTINGFIGGSSNIAIGSTTISNGRHKIAVAYKSGDSAFYIDGVQIGVSSTSFTIAALTKFSFNAFSGVYVALEQIKDAKLYNTRLTNAELAALTTL